MRRNPAFNELDNQLRINFDFQLQETTTYSQLRSMQDGPKLNLHNGALTQIRRKAHNKMTPIISDNTSQRGNDK